MYGSILSVSWSDWSAINSGFPISISMAEVRQLETMHSEHYFIIEAYLKIGKAPIEAANYSKSKIEKELKAYNLQQGEKLRFSPKILAEIEEDFREEVGSQSYVAKSDFMERLRRIFEANGITFKVRGDGKRRAIQCVRLPKPQLVIILTSLYTTAIIRPHTNFYAFKSELVRNS